MNRADKKNWLKKKKGSEVGNQKQAVRLPQKAELIKIQYAAASAEAGVGYGGGRSRKYHSSDIMEEAD